MKATLQINGIEIEVEVSEEQIEKLTEKKKSPFKRSTLFERYFYISPRSIICESLDDKSELDDNRYSVANYCTDKDLIQQQAYREILNRLLWRWQYENDESIDWGNVDDHFFTIEYDFINDTFVACWTVASVKMNTVYFSSDGKAYQAIEEVVKPFMKEHPDFVW